MDQSVCGVGSAAKDSTVKRERPGYTSATQALNAYIDEFSGSQPKVRKYYRDVSDLLTPRSALELTVERSLQTDVRDTPQEARLYKIRQMVDRAYEQVLADEQHRSEVKTALQQSSRLLREISSDEMTSVHSSSSDTDHDMGSMTTDFLLSIPAGRHGNRSSGKSKNSHMYSYRSKKPTPLGQSLDGGPFSSDTKLSVRDSSLPVSGKENKPWGYSSERAGHTLKNVDSKYSLKNTDSFRTVLSPKMTLSQFQPEKLRSEPRDASKRGRPLPSYIGELEMSHVTDHGHVTPSWVDDLEDMIGPCQREHVPPALRVNSAMKSKSSDYDKMSVNQNIVSRGKPPSWVDALDSSVVSGRPAPSWVGDLDSSALASRGHSLPSYIGTLDKSCVSSLSVAGNVSGGKHSSSSESDMSRRTPLRVLSWFQDLEKGNNIVKPTTQAPSWVGDLEVSAYHGRPNPSWIGDVSTSTAITQAKEELSAKPRHFEGKSEEKLSQSLSSNSSQSSKLSLDDLKTTPRKSKGLVVYEGRRMLKENVGKAEKISNLNRDSRTVFRGHLHGNKNPANKGDNLKLKQGPIKKSYSGSLSQHSTKNSARKDHESRKENPTNDLDAVKADCRRNVYEKRAVSSVTQPSHPAGQLVSSVTLNFKPGVYDNVNRTLSTQEVNEHLTASEIAVLDKYKVKVTGGGDVTGKGSLTRLSLSPIKLADEQSAKTETPVGSPPNTDIILDGDRTWERIPSYKSPKCVQELKTSSTIQDSGKKMSPRLTGRQQPGGMEALKNMLFTLQAVASSADTELNEGQGYDGDTVAESSQSHENLHCEAEGLDNDTRDVIMEQFATEPGGKSLERAMQHLSRLKSLVAMGNSEKTSGKGSNE